uniref:Malate dehydrogenase-like n=1 Tax=Rhizophora mucronata TaxID=61149 RepID=A0A2P2MAG2_RHIMU
MSYLIQGKFQLRNLLVFSAKLDPLPFEIVITLQVSKQKHELLLQESVSFVPKECCFFFPLKIFRMVMFTILYVLSWIRAPN